MNNNFQNPFEGILSQMNHAKQSYDQTMSALQGQLQQARQQMNVFQQPFNQIPVQQSVNSSASTSTPAQVNQNSENISQVIPVGIEQITILGEIKAAIEKGNETQEKLIELFGNFVNANAVTAGKNEPKKPQGNETAKN